MLEFTAGFVILDLMGGVRQSLSTVRASYKGCFVANFNLFANRMCLVCSDRTQLRVMAYEQYLCCRHSIPIDQYHVRKIHKHSSLCEPFNNGNHSQDKRELVCVSKYSNEPFNEYSHGVIHSRIFLLSV